MNICYIYWAYTCKHLQDAKCVPKTLVQCIHVDKQFWEWVFWQWRIYGRHSRWLEVFETLNDCQSDTLKNLNFSYITHWLSKVKWSWNALCGKHVFDKDFELKTWQVYFIYPFPCGMKLGQALQTCCVNFFHLTGLEIKRKNKVDILRLVLKILS